MSDNGLGFEEYFEAVKRASELSPVGFNFYSSIDLWRVNGWRAVQRGGWWVVVDKDSQESFTFLPPVSEKHGFGYPADWVDLGIEQIWCGFVGWEKGRRLGGAFSLFDRQYIYDPIRFRDLSGGAFKKLRKNIRRFERQFEYPDELWFGWVYEVPRCLGIDRRRLDESLLNLVSDWLLMKMGEDFYGIEGLNRYLFDTKNRAVLLQFSGASDWKLLGVVAWDTDFRGRVCFRFSIPSTQYRYCDEYLRFRFYRFMDERLGVREVNDGGDLGRESLAEFKRLLRPLRIEEVYQWVVR